MSISTDISKQASELVYPDKPEIEYEVFKGFEDFVGTKKEIRAEEDRLNQLVDDTLKKRRQAYNVKLREIEAVFARRLRATYGPSLNEKYDDVSDVIFNKAWERAHSSGYSEVETEYQSVIEFYDIIVELLPKT